MAKIIVFVPDPNMLTQAETIIAQKQLDAKVIYTDSEHILSILRTERARGALVAVARGNHAHLIKENTDVPLAEIVITGQELALLISKAKAQCDHPDDCIALIGFYSMFSDVRPIAKVLEANVKVYYAADSKSVDDMVHQAYDEGAKLIIGGEKAIACAQKLGLRTQFLNPMRDSIKAAIDTAKSICYGIEMEEKKTSEFMSLMDYTFDAVIRLDCNGVVEMANANAEMAFHMPSNKMSGRFIFDMLKAGEEGLLKKAILERRELHATILRILGKEYIANLAMLGSMERLEGFILSMQLYNHVDAVYLGGEAQAGVGQGKGVRRLSEYAYPSAAMRSLCRDAEHIAEFQLPVLITGRFGTDKARLAEGIHAASSRAEKPLIRLDLASIPAEMQKPQMSIVGGARKQKTVFESALSGTVLIESVELLTPQMQPYLTHICKNGWVLDANMQAAFPVNCRIIATTNVDLNEEARQGRFSPALLQELSRITLSVPSLAQRREDLPVLIDEHLAALCKKYNRQVQLGPVERNLLMGSDWPRDELELAQFLEKLVVFAVEQEADEELIERIRRYMNMEGTPAAPQPVEMQDGEKEKLMELIEQYRGNREQIAAAMGISKTTLWRKLRKHGLIRQ